MPNRASATPSSSRATRRCLARAGATVVLEVQAELKALLAGLAGVASCHARGEKLPAYDVHCPLGSLPLALQDRAGDHSRRYPLSARRRERIWRNGGRASQRCRASASPCVWAGNASHPNDRNRSIDLEAARTAVRARRRFLRQHPARTARARCRAAGAPWPTSRHLGDDLADMADTAAVAALADLTIAVDTAVAHLAGASDVRSG